MKITRASRVLVAATLTLGLGLGAGAASIAPANAATASFVATPNGMVGVEQSVLIYAPSLKGQAITVGFALGSAGSSQQTVVGSNGYASMSWTPNLAGAWTISGLGNAIAAGSTTINIAAMPTTIQLMAPTNATSNAITSVTAVVTAQGGDLAPLGSVNVQSGYGQPVGVQGLTPIAGTESSYATLSWQPQILGPFPLVATYTPDSGAMLSSVSPTVTSQIVPNAGAIELRLPGTYRVGTPVALSAIVTPNTTAGTAAFSISSGYASGSITLVNGVATTQWTPTQQGNQIITTAYSSNVAGGPSGRVTQAVNVLAPLPADTVNVNSPTGPWGPGRPISIRQGTSVNLSTSTASGTQVLLSETGPCVINGSIITGLGSGTCTVTAASIGGNGYSAQSEEFVVSVTTKPKKKKR